MNKWIFKQQYTDRTGRVVVEQINTATGKTRRIDANTGRTLPRR